MLAYARSDTHYLLYIYDNLRNALLDRSGSRAHTPSDPSTSSGDPNPSATLLREVLSRSQETSLRTYEKELYDAETGTGFGGWDALAKKWNRSFLTVTDTRSNQRLEIYKAVHAWRDRVARLEDESTRYEVLQLLVIVRTDGDSYIIDMSSPTTTSFHWQSSPLPTWLHFTVSSLQCLQLFVYVGSNFWIPFAIE